MRPAPTTPSSPTASPTREPRQLTLRLAAVAGKSPIRELGPARLAGPAEAVRSVLDEVYGVLVDPPSSTEETKAVLVNFSGDARTQAERDVDRLIVPAEDVDEIRPTRAVVRIRFVADASGRPIAAFARSELVATAIVDDAETPMAHHGDFTLRKLNGAWRVVAYRLRGRPPEAESDGAAQASFLPGFPSNDPSFVLVIGSDARPGRNATNARADSIHIVGVNPRLGQASVLGIPRDSWVPIPGSGTNKINAALVRGGPDLVVRTVEQLTGISIDGFVLTGFTGFVRLVSAVRGFDVRIPYPIHDAAAEANFDRGREHLSGKEALAFSRARHDVPAGDFSRSLNQGRVIVAALATLRAQVAQEGAALVPWVLASGRHLHTDLSLVEIVELLLAASAFEPGRTRNAVASGSGGSVGGLSVVFLGSRARAMFRDLARDGVLGG